MADYPEARLADYWARQRRRPHIIGREIYHLASVGSTMDVARELAASAGGEGLVVRAEEQTAGRGRQGRRWVAPAGTSLLFTVVLRPPLQAVEALPMAAAVAVVRAVRRATGLNPAIKWPNDLVVDGRKFGGILVETEFFGNELAWALVGIGLNVNWDPGSEVPKLAGQATGLVRELGRPVDREVLFREVLLELDRAYIRLLGGWSPFWAWRRRLITVGREVEVVAGSEKLRGLAAGVDRAGRLRLRTESGRSRVISFGDVFSLVRPGPAQ
ncbi:MAG: biotin--[acetyl-CoA-carboxylase] ligase [Chloroflexota bacterium]